MSTALDLFAYEQHQKASKVTSDQQELLKNVAKKSKKKQIHGTALWLDICVSSLCFFRSERRGNHFEKKKMKFIVSSRLLSTTSFNWKLKHSSWKLEQHNFHENCTIREWEVIWKDSKQAELQEVCAKCTGTNYLLFSCIFCLHLCISFFVGYR